ncbi:MAG: reverse transcriptase-like protein [Clostridiaceae bacterium]|jgi:ribonuclease HI|nr:reverse transcriptase-like protein [Clostridiaceae bacterium]
MTYICEEELKSIYCDLEPKLLALGVEPEIALIRDYMLKIQLKDKDTPLGKLIVDYSPKRRSFNFRRDSDMSEDQFKRITESLGVTVNPGAKNKPKKIKPHSKEIFDHDVSTLYYAFVDGSFIDGCTGYGAVILKENNIVAEISGKVDSPEAFNSRQVAGEIQAVIEVLEWCKDQEINEITIFYDFQNIEKWATGKFRTNTPMTQAYKEYIDNSGVKITWVKVESHTGIELNERADALAKSGARK